MSLLPVLARPELNTDWGTIWIYCEHVRELDQEPSEGIFWQTLLLNCGYFCHFWLSLLRFSYLRGKCLKKVCVPFRNSLSWIVCGFTLLNIPVHKQSGILSFLPLWVSYEVVIFRLAFISLKSITMIMIIVKSKSPRKSFRYVSQKDWEVCAFPSANRTSGDNQLKFCPHKIRVLQIRKQVKSHFSRKTAEGGFSHGQPHISLHTSVTAHTKHFFSLFAFAYTLI